MIRSPMLDEASDLSFDRNSAPNAPQGGGDVVHVRFNQQCDIETEDAAEYLGAMLSDLRVIAAKSGFKFLAALIEVAAEEARLQSHKENAYADIA
ncbi:MAG: hypothetical protein NW215_12445 [Hyphomicrobiales bacterium]|nr:hypothetical protein [Hyphomicrobiales bacterium]